MRRKNDDDDDHRILRDGETRRVRMIMRDGLSPLQRAVARDSADAWHGARAER
jgi:hypothetical protein